MGCAGPLYRQVCCHRLRRWRVIDHGVINDRCKEVLLLATFVLCGVCDMLKIAVEGKIRRNHE